MAVSVGALGADAEDLAATATRRTAEAARLLTSHGLSDRDTDVALGISPQRVSQLTDAAQAS